MARKVDQPPLPQHCCSTKEGNDWVTYSLDPMHDRPVTLAGLPDDDVSATVVQSVKRTYTLSAPAGTVAPWTAHIFSLPLQHQQSTSYPMQHISGSFNQRHFNGAAPVISATDMIGYQARSGVAALPLGTQNIHAWATDITTPIFPNGSNAYVAPATAAQLSAGASPVGGSVNIPTSRMRLIGMGFEVVNTTASLYKSGTVTVSRIPSRQRLESTFGVGNTGNVLQSSSGSYTNTSYASPPQIQYNLVGGPPPQLTDAIAYNGTKQWEAARGCYSVCTMRAEDNPLTVGTTIGVAVMGDDVIDTTEAAVASAVVTRSCIYTAANETTTPVPVYVQQTQPFDVTSQIYTGLAPETVLTITVNFLIEIAPRNNDITYGQLVYSTSPSAAFDGQALATYQQMASHQPPGVPAGMNPAGEWWRFVQNMARKITPVVRVIRDVLPNPITNQVTHLVERVGAIERGEDPPPQKGSSKAVKSIAAKSSKKVKK